MPLLKLGPADGLVGTVTRITLRTEDVEAIYAVTSASPPHSMAVAFRSGERIGLDTNSPANLAALYAKLEAAL